MNKVSNLVASVAILSSLARECWAVSELNETDSPVEFMVLDENSIPMAYSDTPFVGQILQLYFYLRDELVFKDLLIESCTAYNNLADTDQKPWKLLDRGCPTQSGKLVTNAQEARMHVKTLLNGTRVQTHGKVLPIKAFVFTGSSSIKMDCSYKICKQDDISECQLPVNCGELDHKDPEALADSPTKTSGETSNETEDVRREKRTASNTRYAAREKRTANNTRYAAGETRTANYTQYAAGETRTASNTQYAAGEKRTANNTRYAAGEKRTANNTRYAAGKKRTASNTRMAAGEEKIVSVLLTMSAYERQAGNITI